MNASSGGKPVTDRDGAAVLRRAMRRAAEAGSTAADASAEVAEVINTYQATLLRTTGSYVLEAEDVMRISKIIGIHTEVEERSLSRRLIRTGQEAVRTVEGRDVGGGSAEGK